MKKVAIAATLLLASPAFGQSGEPLRAALTGYQEVPAVSSQADGVFEARVSGDGMSVDWTLAYDGLQASVIMAHIHFAQLSVNGPIIVWLCGTVANPGPEGTATCPQSGSVSGTFTAANVLAAAPTQQLAAGEIGELIAAMREGAAYVNVHTSLSPAGEIRGQVGSGGNSGNIPH